MGDTALQRAGKLQLLKDLAKEPVLQFSGIPAGLIDGSALAEGVLSNSGSSRIPAVGILSEYLRTLQLQHLTVVHQFDSLTVDRSMLLFVGVEGIDFLCLQAKDLPQTQAGDAAQVAQVVFIHC